jgi:Fe-S oxidoreductase
VLRFGGDVRDQDRGHVDGDALRQAAPRADTRAEVCTAADTSCLMHIGGALRPQRAGVRTMHLAEILAAQE